MSYYWFNRQKLLPKPKYRYHDCGGKEKAAKYYLENEEALKEKARNKYRNLSKEEKEAYKEYGRLRYLNKKEKPR